MKFFVMISLLLIIVLAGIGCTSAGKSSPPEIGYILEVKDNRVLILEDLKGTDIGKTWNQVFEHYQGRAIWLKTDDVAALKAGQKVRYWVNGPVAESYPEQGTAKKIEVVS